MSKQYFSIADLPDPEKDKELWDLINNPGFKTIANVMILNEARKYEPETLSPEACRTQLAKIKAFSEMLDLPSYLQNKANKPEDTSDELPD